MRFKPTWEDYMERIWNMGTKILTSQGIRLIAVLGMLGLFWACYPSSDISYSNPQDSTTSQWLIEYRTGQEKVQIELRYEHRGQKGKHTNSHGFSIDPSRLNGLTREQAMSN